MASTATKSALKRARDLLHHFPSNSSPTNAQLDPTLLQSSIMYPNALQNVWSLITRHQAPAPGETAAPDAAGNAQSLRFERYERVLDAPHARRSNKEDLITSMTPPVMRSSPVHLRRNRQPSYNQIGGYDYVENIVQDCVDSNDALKLYITRYKNGEIDPKEFDAVLCSMLARIDRMVVEHTPDDRRLRRPRRALVKLCVATKTPPSALFEDGVITDVTEFEASGGYGKISSGFLGNQKIAFKQLFVNRKAEPQTAQTALYREVLVWTMLHHPSILPLLGLVPGANDMICPWMENGDLRTYIQRHCGDIKLGLKQTWILQIASGLAYLHANRVVHGDLHGGNILLDENMHAQISDFGLTTLVDAGLTTMGISTWSHGMFNFTAPELLGAGTRCTLEGDVYSFACLCLQIVTGQPPWEKSNYLQVFKSLIEKKRNLCWPDVADATLDGLRPLMERCWSRDPDARPQMREVLLQLEALFAAAAPQ